jgi:hypothetical protein
MLTVVVEPVRASGRKIYPPNRRTMRFRRIRKNAWMSSKLVVGSLL